MGSEEGMIPLVKTVKSAPTKLTTISKQFNQLFYRNRTNLNKRKNVAFCNFAQVKRQPPICRYFRFEFCCGGESGVKNGFLCKFAHPKLCKRLWVWTQQ